MARPPSPRAKSAATNAAELFLRLGAFVGFTDAEARLVRQSSPALLPHAQAVVDAVYDHLLSHPQTAPFFSDPAGQPDLQILAERKKSLGEWLAACLEVQPSSAFAAYTHRIGQAHARVGVPPEYLVGTMAFAQTAIAALLAQALPARAIPTIQAWNKLLMLQLVIMLSSYTISTRRPGHKP